MSESSVKRFQQQQRKKERERAEAVHAFFYSTRYWKFRKRFQLAWAILFKAWGQKRARRAAKQAAKKKVMEAQKK